MSVSILDLIKEEAREARTGDDLFFSKKPYLFVLNGPTMKGPIGPSGYAVFPLPVNPTSFVYDLPFAVELTPLQQAGVSCEEGGICIGEISLDASMGFKPKMDRSANLGPGDGDFTGLLGMAGGLAYDELSGQMHFWRLANRCFDAYSAFKKNPEHAHKTSMEFHSMRDDLHLQVVPRTFSLNRSAERERVSYRMQARLAVVGFAGKIYWPSPDKDLISKIKDTISAIRNAVQMIAATIDDVTAAIDDIRRTISSVVGILDDFKGAINSFSAVIDGTKAFLDIPRQTLVSLTEQTEAVADLAANVAGWPADVVQAWRDLADQADALTVAGTDYFAEGWDRQIERYHKLVAGTPVEINSKEFPGQQTTPGMGDTTSSVVDVFGGGEKPGDARRAGATVTENRLTAQYQGFAERVVGQGDSIQSLAAKYLGDARRWLDLVLVNDLKVPYITDQAQVPGTLRVGDRIVIPVAAPQVSADVITSGAAEIGDSQAANDLGEDFLMVQQLDGTLGWEINAEGGGTDVRHVRGIDNFSQALWMRFKTEQGTNILYPNIGLPRVGITGTIPNTNDLRYQARVQLLADKRVERLAGFKFATDNDKVTLEADLQPVGFSGLRTISRTLT